MSGEWVKRTVRKAMEGVGAYPFYALARTGPLHEDGWFRSIRVRESIDAEGRPIPWITYPAIDFLSRRIRPDMAVFEYGCGSSTQWWAERVGRVVSVEHNPAWYERIRREVPANVTLALAEATPDGPYSRKASEFGPEFDLVVIDGEDRNHCARHALDALNPGGVILWDNSDRPEYEEGFQLLFDRGFRKIEFTGLAPGLYNRSETAFFYRNDNRLGI